MLNRRQLLQHLGAGFALSCVPYSSIAATHGDGIKYGMVIDVRRCTNCQSCLVSCSIENGVPQGRSRGSLKRMSVQQDSHLTSLTVPVQCAQCDRPACVEACPADATGKLNNGIVYIDYDACIGCQSCVEACPYQARVADPNFEVPPEKCNFCLHRLEAGLLPACVESCIGSARVFGDLNDPDSKINALLKNNKIYTLLKQENTQPNIFFIGLPDTLDEQAIITMNEMEWQR
ncbi:tetrathionate reductase subunit B [Ferrimonas sediminum]|uniref:Tetrathionate reductase subunit B n=1 Tax=Ferrimonas sediminum TaxID=718193 RepID=A0A1G8YAJ6_9GAMM|nr:4Fe-4S dicluster domain-containing protein [Ferrimonas sediminum]SDJ99255.1 tetrathionate reductase subunit B [Ferrimonas sediminum]